MNGAARRELVFLAMLGLCLFGIILFSKSVYGVEFGFVPRKPLSIGFQETRHADTWAVSFDQLNGKIKNSILVDGETPETIYLSMKAGGGKVTFRIQSDTITRDFDSLSDIMEIPLSQFGKGVIRFTLIGEKAAAGNVYVRWGDQIFENSDKTGSLIQN